MRRSTYSKQMLFVGSAVALIKQCSNGARASRLRDFIRAIARFVKGLGPGPRARRLAAALVGGVLLAAALVAPAVVGVPAAAASGPCTTTPQTINGTAYLYTTCTYTYTGGEQQFVMPPGVSLVMTVYAIGAAGQGGQNGITGDQAVEPNLNEYCSPSGTQSTGSGGGGSEGAEVAGAIQDVPVGTTLYVEVGGTGSYDFPNSFVGEGPVSLGGWNGGGPGGQGSTIDPGNTFSDYECGGFGGAGGGASDIQTCSIQTSDCVNTGNATTDPRLIVAAGGGGGGGGGYASDSTGFAGGSAGQAGTGDGTTFVQGGGAGANSNGAGGTGQGPSTTLGGIGGGGGGGGGWYGGGGGDNGSVGGGAGGGGGSNLLPAFVGNTPPGCNTSVCLTTLPAQVQIDYYQVDHPSTTTLSASPNPILGQPVTYTATVSKSGLPPTGTVTFTNGGTTVCSRVPLSTTPPYTATCSQTYQAAGPQTVTAAYSGDTDTLDSQDQLQVTVGKADQQTLSVTGPQSATYGSAPYRLTFAGGSGSGMVSFDAGSSTACRVLPPNPNHPLQTWTLTVTSGTGSCTLTATNSGDASYNPTTSAPFNVTINKASQAPLTVTGPQSGTYGSAYALTSSGGSGSGAVSFDVGSSTACTIPASGANAGLLVITSGTGSCTLTATKAGDNNYDPGLTSAPFNVTINKASQAPLTVTGPQSGTYGNAYALTSSGGSGSGAVSFDVGSSTACTIPTTGADAGMLVVTSGTGSCTLTATQAGDNNYDPGLTSAPFTVTINKAALSVTARDKQMTYGGAVPTFDATATGLVGSDTFASLGGSCTATVEGTPVSSTTPAGTYPGAISCAGASTVNYNVTYSTGTLTVNQAATTTAVGASANPSPQGQAVTFTATVTATAPGGGTPTGTVNFFDGATKIGSAPLSGGQATFSTSSLSLGARSITATYAGNSNYAASPPSPTLTENVDTNLSGYRSLTSANLAGAYLANANLSGQNLGSANLSGATLSGANLSGANLTNANLTNANLAGANLTGATLSRANLRYTTLTGANLTNANLGYTNLKGATGLGTATLTGASWSYTNCPDNTLSNNDGGSCSPNHMNP